MPRVVRCARSTGTAGEVARRADRRSFLLLLLRPILSDLIHRSAGAGPAVFVVAVEPGPTRRGRGVRTGDGHCHSVDVAEYAARFAS